MSRSSSSTAQEEDVIDMNRVRFEGSEKRNGSPDHDEHGTSQPSTSSETWRKIYEHCEEFDSRRFEKLEKYIDSLLTFAGLFSAVLTAFLVQVYPTLQPDNTQLAAPILLDISLQLYSISLGQTAPATNVSLPAINPSRTLVAANSFWFASLVTSLGAALLGVFIKQWLRQYMRWTDVVHERDAVSLRLYRDYHLSRSLIEAFTTNVADLLELALVLFLIGLEVVLWKIDTIVAGVTTAFLCWALVIAFGTLGIPALVPGAPYRTTMGLVCWKLYRRLSDLSYTYVSTRIHDFIHKHKDFPSLLIDLPGFLKKLAGELVNYLIGFLKEDIWEILTDAAWFGADMIDSSNRPWKSAVDRSISFLSLVDRARIPPDLVEQCFSDFPSSITTISNNAFAYDYAPKHISRKREKENTLTQFKAHFLALLSLLRCDNEVTGLLEDICNHQDLVAIFSDRSEGNEYGGSRIHLLARAIHKADTELSHNAISEYFVSLAEKLQDSELQLSIPSNVDSHFATSLSCIIFLLCYGLHSSNSNPESVHGFGIDDTDLGTQSKARLYRYLAVFAKLLLVPQSPSDMIQGSQTCYNTMIDLLAYRPSQKLSFFDIMLSSSPNGNTVVNVMTIAQRIVAYNELGQESDDEKLSKNELEQKKQAIRPITDVFWRVAGSIFRYDLYDSCNTSMRAAEISPQNRMMLAFLTAVKTVLQTQVAVPEENNPGTNSDQPAYYIVAYVLRNQPRLPAGFTHALFTADGEVFSISKMLSWVYSRSPNLTGGIQEPNSFWDKLGHLHNQPDTVTASVPGPSH